MEPEIKHVLKRREFLAKIAAAAIASAPIGTILSGCAITGLTVYSHARRNGAVALRISDYTELGSVGGAIELDIVGVADPIVVVRRSAEEFLALSPICTHLGCTVRKEPAAFRCPCHGSTYALDGTVVRGPAEKPLANYRTEKQGETLVIYL